MNNITEIVQPIGPSLRDPKRFYWDDLNIRLLVNETTQLHFGSCTRKAIWLRTKPQEAYQDSPLGSRRASARRLMEQKDYTLLKEGLEPAAYGGVHFSDTETIDLPIGDSVLELTLPLIRLVEGLPTVIIVRSLGSRSSCYAGIYGEFKAAPQPQVRDLLYVSVLLDSLARQPLPIRAIDRVLLIYSDQAMQNTKQYLISPGPDGPIVDGLAYHEMSSSLILKNLTELIAGVATNGTGEANFMYPDPDTQLAAVTAGYINKGDVGWQPVCGWPCKACGFSKHCLPPNCKGIVE